MKLKILCSLLVFLFALPLIAAPPEGGKYSGSKALLVDNTTYIDANRILMFVTNHGNFGRDLSDFFGHDYGTWYPYGGNPDLLFTAAESQWSPNYATGLWIGGVDRAVDSLRVTVSEFSSEYVAGPMAGGTFQSDRPEFKVYKLYSDSLVDNPNQDYTDYMADAVAQGAPLWDEDTYFVDTTLDPPDSVLIGVEGEPQMYGDQFLWTVFNDADPSAHTNNNGETPPLGIEVKQSVFAYDRDDPLGDVVFFRYRIYNKGGKTLDSCYFSIWCDPDLGNSGDDLVGCDVEEGIGFVWQSSAQDGNYLPTAPPSMGIDFLQGPLVGKTDPEQPDGKMWGEVYSDSTNFQMTSFNKYINGTDPDDAEQTYNFMRGLTKTGNDYLYDGQVTKFVVAGDPVTGQGDIDFAPADRRFMMTTGPVTFAPGDSTEIYAAMVLGQAVDNKTSISLMRFHDRFAQLTYDNDFNVLKPPAPPVVTASYDENVISLSWTDTSEVDPGSYPFEGYTVFQGETPTGPFKKVATFDILNGIADVFDESFNAITGVPEIVLVRNGDDIGLKRYITITEDVINSLPLRNVTEYYYKIEAYSVNLEGPLGVRSLSSSSDIATVIPHDPVLNWDYGEVIGDMVDVVHSAGVSDGIVTVEVVNPEQLTGNSYQVVFEDTLGIVVDTTFPFPINFPDSMILDSTNIAWHLINTTTSTTLLEWQADFDGGDKNLIIDGFLLRVSGPAAGFKSFEVVANGAGVVDPPDAGALWFGDFPVPTFNDETGYITDAQQSSLDKGQWGFHTADNGGTNDGGSRGGYDAFLERVMRNDNPEDVGIYDWEMRFTGSYDAYGVNGSHAIRWFQDDSVMWVPYELWRIGIGTPDDPSDDVKLFSFIISESPTYDLENWGDSDNGGGPGGYEHSVSGANNDPYTDWVYWVLPDDVSAGTAGYDAVEATLLDSTYAGAGEEVMARTVLVSWNGGSEPPFVQALPEQGTVFRLVTGKPQSSEDVYAFSTTPPTELTAKSEAMLDKIITVPNPFYLNSSYDPAPGNYALKFHHLPETCTIRIYNLVGELLRTIEKDDASTAIATWDLLTEVGLPVSSGIYLYVVDAPGFGQKIGKMAVFVEQEVLQIF